MIVKLLTEHHLEFLSLKGGCRGSSESTHVICHIVGNLMHWLNYGNSTENIHRFMANNESLGYDKYIPLLKT